MSTIPGLNQIQFEGFCRFITKGLTEELDQFPKEKMEEKGMKAGIHGFSRFLIQVKKIFIC